MRKFRTGNLIRPKNYIADNGIIGLHYVKHAKNRKPEEIRTDLKQFRHKFAQINKKQKALTRLPKISLQTEKIWLHSTRWKYDGNSRQP